jgi:hypothetical protein
MKTLSELKSICQYHGWQDNTTTGLAQLTHFINETLQLLASLMPWPEYNKIDGKVVCAATAEDFSAVDGDGSEVTITLDSHSFIVGDVVDITGTGNWDETDRVITEVTDTTIVYASEKELESSSSSSSENGTVTKKIENTGLTNTNIWKIGTLIRTDRAAPLDELDSDEYIRMLKYYTGSGQPTHYYLERNTILDSVTTRLHLYPIPLTSTTLYYAYTIHPKILSGDSDKTDWPDMRLHLFGNAVRYRLAAQDRDASGLALYSSEFMTLVKKAYSFSRPSNKPFIANDSGYPGWKYPIRHIEKTFI